MDINIDLLKQQLKDVVDVNNMIAKNKTIEIGVNMDLYRKQKIENFMSTLDSIKNNAVNEIDAHFEEMKKKQIEHNQKIFGVHDLFKQNNVYS